MKEEMKTIEQLKWNVFCVLDDYFKYVSKTMTIKFHNGERYRVCVSEEE